MKNTIGVNYLCLGTYWINITAPWTCWHKGTAFHLDTMKPNPCFQPEHAELGIDLVLLSMAARLTHSLFSLAKNIIHKRIWCWKMLPRACVTKAFHGVLWLVWNVMDLLIALKMTDMLCNKYSTPKLAGHTGIIMSSATIKCLAAEPSSSEGEAPTAKSMEHFQDTMSMEDKMWSKGLLLPCTNPLILSMICQPSDDDASSTSGESDGSEWETEDDFSLEKELPSEGMSTDCSLPVFWSKAEDDGDESDWSDSWDTDSNPDSSKVDEDLWASFCQNDDPYNPLCFSMPTNSPKKHLDVPEAEKKLSYLEMQEPDRIKKVRFSPDITVITLPEDDTDRKGPWEEYARDRCRFQKRIKESGGAISYCLEPEFRRDVWIRLYGRDGL